MVVPVDETLYRVVSRRIEPNPRRIPMSESNQTPEFYEFLDKVLLRCWIYGFVLLYVWFGIVVFANDAVHRLTVSMFDISKHELSMIIYGGIVFHKLIVILFFLFPWMAIRSVLRGEKT
jgi:hypothetical protein